LLSVQSLLNGLTKRIRVRLEKLIVTHLMREFSAFYGTRRFITMFTRARHWSQTSPRRI
jgi:hypothetical protein